MEIELRNVGIIRSAHLQFVQGLNLIVGASSSGKSTLLRAIRSMMDNTFSDSNISYGQRKLAIRIQYNDHSATYIRDLDNSSRKSAYQIDGKVYTKIGRTSLEDLSNLFKLKPVEIDGEKINFNFSAQFSGPFLLLGSSSLLYSILTYRSSFDITKINDLYFSDFKNTKKELDAVIKTKKTLEKERDKKCAELKKLENVPTLYTKVNILKNKNEEYTKMVNLHTLYRSSVALEIQKNKEIILLKNILKKYEIYNALYKAYTLLMEYRNTKKEYKKAESFLRKTAKINNKILSVMNKYNLVLNLHHYVTSCKDLLLYKENYGKLEYVNNKLLSFIKTVTIKGFLSSYKKSILQQEKSSYSISNIIRIQDKVNIFVKEYSKVIMLGNYLCSTKTLNSLINKVQLMDTLCSKIDILKSSSSLCSLLLLYCKVRKKILGNKNILNYINITDTDTLFVLQQYLVKQKEIATNKESLSKIENTLKSVLENIKGVGICPLCKQSLCDCQE